MPRIRTPTRGRSIRAVLIATLLASGVANAAPKPCEPDSKLSYREASNFAAENRHGLFLGMSETEFQRFAASARRTKLYNVAKDKSWERPNESIYIIDEDLATTKRELGSQQIALFSKGELIFIADQVQDRQGSAPITRAAADAVMADYRRYMCWRFGAVSDRSSMGPKTRSAIIGPVQIYDQAGAGNDQISMDAFLVEDLSRKSNGVGLTVVTRLTRFGQD
jgi:hypothetical protein